MTHHERQFLVVDNFTIVLSSPGWDTWLEGIGDLGSGPLESRLLAMSLPDDVAVLYTPTSNSELWPTAIDGEPIDY